MLKKILLKIGLFITYYFIVTPIGLVFKIFDINYLDHHSKSENKTYWHYRG